MTQPTIKPTKIDLACADNKIPERVSEHKITYVENEGEMPKIEFDPPILIGPQEKVFVEITGEKTARATITPADPGIDGPCAKSMIQAHFCDPTQP